MPDADLNTVLNHISQLKPILQKNHDIIDVMSLGFVGLYGELHSSTHSLDSIENIKTISSALLSALPSDRMMLIRKPLQKWNIFNLDKNGYLDAHFAYSGAGKARVGISNDCFASDQSDYGTYLPLNMAEDYKNFLNFDNRFVPQTGEVCINQTWNNTFGGCNNVLREFERMRWSSISHGTQSIRNALFVSKYQEEWIKQGCFNEIQRRLGYRFALVDGEFTSSVNPGGYFNIKLNIRNDGFAAPHNPRNVELIFRNNVNGAETTVRLPDDPRFWMGGTTNTIDRSITLPPSITPGNYKLFFSLPDPESALYGNPAYSIRLANKNIWEISTGYNDLGHILSVTGQSDHQCKPVCAGNQSCQNGKCVSVQICIPKTCATLGNYECGSQSDGCGKTLNCGSCAVNKNCSNGKCVTNCASHASKKCDGGNLYWYNSCNAKEELAQNCGVNVQTSNYRCSGNIIQREAITKGCLNNACTSQSAWSNLNDCASDGKICSNGVCVARGSSVVTDTKKDNDSIAKDDTKSAPKMTRAQILARIAEIKKLIAQLIMQLIAELQKQAAGAR
jgi:hypothetical protein